MGKIMTLQTRLESINSKVPLAANILSDMNSKIIHLEDVVGRLVTERNSARRRVKHLEACMNQEIAKAIEPIHLDLAIMGTQMMEKNVKNASEKMMLAKLWPKHYIMPSCLIPFQSSETDNYESNNNKLDEEDITRNNTVLHHGIIEHRCPKKIDQSNDQIALNMSNPTMGHCDTKKHRDDSLSMSTGFLITHSYEPVTNPVFVTQAQEQDFTLQHRDTNRGDYEKLVPTDKENYAREEICGLSNELEATIKKAKYIRLKMLNISNEIMNNPNNGFGGSSSIKSILNSNKTKGEKVQTEPNDLVNDVPKNDQSHLINDYCKSNHSQPFNTYIEDPIKTAANTIYAFVFSSVYSKRDVTNLNFQNHPSLEKFQRFFEEVFCHRENKSHYNDYTVNGDLFEIATQGHKKKSNIYDESNESTSNQILGTNLLAVGKEKDSVYDHVPRVEKLRSTEYENESNQIIKKCALKILEKGQVSKNEKSTLDMNEESKNYDIKKLDFPSAGKKPSDQQRIRPRRYDMRTGAEYYINNEPFPFANKLKECKEILTHESRMSNLLSKFEKSEAKLYKYYDQSIGNLRCFLKDLKKVKCIIDDDMCKIKSHITNIHENIKNLSSDDYSIPHFVYEDNFFAGRMVEESKYGMSTGPLINNRISNSMKKSFYALKIFALVRKHTKKALKESKNQIEVLNHRIQDKISLKSLMDKTMEMTDMEIKCIKSLKEKLHTLHKKFICERLCKSIRSKKLNAKSLNLKATLLGILIEYDKAHDHTSKRTAVGQNKYACIRLKSTSEKFLLSMKSIRKHIFIHAQDVRTLHEDEICLVQSIFKCICELHSIAIDRTWYYKFQSEIHSVIKKFDLNTETYSEYDDKNGIVCRNVVNIYKMTLEPLERIRLKELKIVEGIFSHYRESGDYYDNKKFLSPKDQLEIFRSIQKKKTEDMIQEVESLRLNLFHSCHKNKYLQNKLEVVTLEYNQSSAQLLLVARNSINLLKEKIVELEFHCNNMRSKYKDKISQILKRENETTKKLSNELKCAKDEALVVKDVSKMLRFEVGKFRIENEMFHEKIEIEKKRYIEDRNILREHLEGEKKRSAMLEIMTHFVIKRNLYLMDLIAKQKKKYKIDLKQSETKWQKANEIIWQQRNAAHLLGVNVDALFLHFVERLANLSGSTKEVNDALQRNGAVRVLLATCECSRTELHHKSLEALSRICWNEEIDQRIIGWDVTSSWVQWVEKARIIQKEIERQQPRFEEDEYSNHITSNSLRLCIRRRRRRAIRKRKIAEGPHEENQCSIISEMAILEKLMKLCESQNSDIVTHALHGLCTVSYNQQTGDFLLRNQTFLKRILYLCDSDDDEIRSLAALFIANVAVDKFELQEYVSSCGGIEIIVKLCKRKEPRSLLVGTAALANLMSNNAKTSQYFYDLGGLELLLELLKSPMCFDLYDADQRGEIQANCIECLSNMSMISRNDDQIRCGIMSHIRLIVLQCASANFHLRLMTPLVIGHLAKDAKYRYDIGYNGAIEALFLVCENNDDGIQANAFWALSNLAWDSSNQERIGKYFDTIIDAGISNINAIQANSLCLLGNMLYYNDRNRTRCYSHDKFRQLFDNLMSGNFPEMIREMFLRVMTALTYDENIAHEISSDRNIWILLKSSLRMNLCVQRLTLILILNFAVHEHIRYKLVQEGFINIIISMQFTNNDTSNAILDLLRSIKPDQKEEKGRELCLKDLIHLYDSKDTSLRLFALEKISEHTELNQETLSEILESDVLSKIFLFCKAYTAEKEQDEILISSIWLLRKLSFFEQTVKCTFGDMGGVEVLLGVLDRCVKNADCNKTVVEAVLSVLFAISIDHTKNCERIISNSGVQILIKLSKHDPKTVTHCKDNLSSNETHNTAHSLLQILRCQITFICSNCRHRQSIGEYCALCGHIF